ncbi:AZF1 [[Candida] subhashii]|uniref:AZF1 n=1 Tax=[Candida] subhashii TaxID=561895 RepID=A0A8J5QW11_9ASCO|nr:AZF1 [[Candida] subhashii]KAG7663265.1 AZF1 [[Candida] subhashii]
MGKSAISAPIRPSTSTTSSTSTNTTSNPNTSISKHSSTTTTKRQQQALQHHLSELNDDNKLLFTPPRQESISNLLASYPSSNSASYTLHNPKDVFHQSSISGPPTSYYNYNYPPSQQQQQQDPSFYNPSGGQQNRRDTMNFTQQSINPNSTNQQLYSQSQQNQPSSQSSQQSSTSQYPQQQFQQPIRPRGDSIFLPPPITSQMRLSTDYDTSQAPNTMPSRSNSIFSSLINIPGSNGNSISEQSSGNNSLSLKQDPKANAGNAPNLPPRSRQMSLIPSQEFSMEDLETLLNKESVGNLLAWQQQAAAGQEGSGSQAGRVKAGSLDLSTWDNQNSITSMPGFTGSLTELIQGMISNGSIDFSNMSNQQRRDSILKIINDQQSLRSQRTEDPKAKMTKLKEDMFDKKQQQQQQQQQQQSQSQQQSEKLRRDQSERQRQQQSQQQGSDRKGGNVSPTSSMSNDEPQSPKTSPTQYNTMTINQPYRDLYTQQQPSQSQQLPQPPIPPQRLFSNYAPPGLVVPPPQNQYQYTSYPNYNLGYSLPRTNSIGGSSYMYPIQFQQQPMQQQQPAYIPPQATTKKSPSSRKRRSPNTQQQQQQLQQQQAQSLSPTSSKIDRDLIPAQSLAKSEDGRPLLGATKIDQLMLVIQARDKGVTKQIQQGPDGSILAPSADTGVLPSPISLVGGVDKPHKVKEEDDPEHIHDHHEDSRKRNRKMKNQQCPYCFKYFTQSTHLEVHIRSHIGIKPFECSYCHKKFTQGGNLRTHLRLHTGEKPFVCDVCSRAFNRKGNLAAHKLTHDNLKPYECKLDGCDKSFTQLGNLKSHQNRFHLNTLNELTHRLAELTGPMMFDNLPEEERDLLNYFKDLYKNSNKGIRGRGKSHHKDGEGGSSTQSSPISNASPTFQPDYGTAGTTGGYQG